MTEARVTVVQCLGCGHTATLGRETHELPLVHLTKRLKCSQCGARTIKAQRVPAEVSTEKPRRN